MELRNTTEFPHPLEGNITRSVVDAGNGLFRILTVGEGKGGLLGDQRHFINSNGLGPLPGGPQLFQELDQITLDYAAMTFNQPTLSLGAVNIRG